VSTARQTSQLPLYYESLIGSLKDVSTLENVLKMLSWLKAKGLHMVMDRGFYSEHNVDCLYAGHILFTVGVPFTTKWSWEFVVKVRGDMEKFGNYHHRVGSHCFFAVTDVTCWNGQTCFRHVYYDSKKAVGE
jgi:transposase